MAVKITEMHTENLPALRLIGKKVLREPGAGFIAEWDEWLEKGWFGHLEKLGVSPENGDRYLGVTDHDGCYWIGLLFSPDTLAPDGFESAEIPAARYAVARFAGKKDKELLSEDGITLIIEEMRGRGLAPAPLWSGWCIERYSRPFAPDGKGKKLLECLYEIQ